MGISAVAMMGVGTAFSMYSQVTAGKAQRDMFEANAKLADMQAADAIERGKYAETAQRRITSRTIGTQRAGLAAQHVDVNVGSASDVQETAAYLGELDALTIRGNAAREAWGYKVDAANSREHGTYSVIQGNTGATQTLLNGGMQLALAYASNTKNAPAPAVPASDVHAA
jgi:hypothetical protein